MRKSQAHEPDVSGEARESTKADPPDPLPPVKTGGGKKGPERKHQNWTTRQNV